MKFGGDFLQGYLEDSAGWGRPIHSGFEEESDIALKAT